MNRLMVGFLGAALLFGAWIPNRMSAGSVTFDFETDPADVFAGVESTQEGVLWSENGPWAGTGNPGGFLSITEATANSSTTVVFDDIDNGGVIKAFSLKADIRVGNGTTDRPADGFSIGFARASDPILDQSLSLPGPPENGTATGIVVSFDSWQGNTLTDGSGDIEGIIVVVDGESVKKIPMPTRHGECDDTSSLQTGPQGFSDIDFPRGDPGTLCWAPLEIDVNSRGVLNVSWKGRKVLENFPSNFFPSPGQVFVAGRTGGANQIVHVDNVNFTTSSVMIDCFGSVVSVSSEEFVYRIGSECYQGADLSQTRFVVNGVLSTEFEFSLNGNLIEYVVPLKEPLTPGVEHRISVTMPREREREGLVFIPEYPVVGSEHALAGPFTDRGFDIRVLQSPITIDNETAAREAHLSGEVADADGTTVANLVDPSGSESEGEIWAVEGVVNFDQEGSPQGVFRADGSGSPLDVPDGFIPGIPGVEGSNDNITAEILTVVEIPERGLYNFAFNSDDGFKTTAGSVYDVEKAIVISEFSGGRGASTTYGRVLFEEAGFYQLRTLWYEGGGGANLEWWTADLEGKPIALLNDDVNGGLKTYRHTPSLPASITKVSPSSGANEIATEGVVLTVSVKAGATSYDLGSARGTLNGGQIAVSESRLEGGTTLTVDPGKLEPNTEYSWEIAFTAGGVARVAGGTFRTTLLSGDGLLFIETEDFNFGLGQWDQQNEIGMSGAYSGGTYQGLGDGLNEVETDAGTSYGVDYFESNNANSQPVYRPGTGVEAGKKNGPAGLDRGDFNVETNHVVGWNDAGDWLNFTRAFPEPARDYTVFGRLASGGDPIDVSLLEVTSSAKTHSQETQLLGHWRPGRATGGWDRFELFPLLDDAGELVNVRLGGETTLRYTVNGGHNDHDFIVFVPVNQNSEEQAEIRVERSAEGMIVIEYSGTLLSSETVDGVFEPVREARSPYVVEASSDEQRFFIAR